MRKVPVETKIGAIFIIIAFVLLVLTVFVFPVTMENGMVFIVMASLVGAVISFVVGFVRVMH